MSNSSRPRAAVADLVALIQRRLQPLSVETVPLPQAARRALAREVVAEVAVPGFDRAAMDGFAVRSADSGPLIIVGESLPGKPFVGEVQSGQAVRIMTGAPLPRGADAVIAVEQVTERDDALELTSPIIPGKHISRRGEDIAPGSRLLPAGRVLRPQDLGLLASAGVGSVFVHRIPKVSILITGDELLPVGARPEGFRIVDSNSVMLAALVQRDGGEPDISPIIPDRRDALREALLVADGDLVLLCGGTSVGRYDHVPALIADEGELLLHGVALRPGAPVGFGDVRGRPVFLLPGNPVSCLAAYDLFAGRALRRLVGRSTDLPYFAVEQPLASEVVSVSGRVDYVRAHRRENQIHPLTARGASVLSTTTSADGFFLVPADRETIPAGESVRFYLYDGQA